jgi:hypothetical protein
MTAGMLIVAASLFVQTNITTSTGYGLLLPAFILLGLGMGLVMSPMSTAAMNSVRQDKAGAASGILTMSRMVGGTFGIAALGALFQQLSSDRLEQLLKGTPVTSAQRHTLVDGLGSGAGGDKLNGLDPETARQVGGAVKNAFIHALSTGMWLGTGVALLGALVAFLFVSDTRAEHAVEEQPERELVPA